MQFTLGASDQSVRPHSPLAYRFTLNVVASLFEIVNSAWDITSSKVLGAVNDLLNTRRIVPLFVLQET